MFRSRGPSSGFVVAEKKITFTVFVRLAEKLQIFFGCPVVVWSVISEHNLSSQH
jgi:hypothetical protein